MDLTQTLGRILSLYLLTSGVAFIVATQFYLRLTQRADRSDLMAVNISGMVHLLVGFGVLVTHFEWGGVAEVLVTLLGVFFTLRGISYYWTPQLVLRPAEQGRGSAQGLRVLGAAFIGYGAVLGYSSFFG